MDKVFWLRKWERGEIGFHESAVNPLLINHFNALSLRKQSRLFLPLCGKSLDIHWLLSYGYRVSGVELSKIAIDQLFEELGLHPKVTAFGPIDRYSARNIDIFGGDIFDMTPAMLGEVDAIYDRAALIALPAPARDLYVSHLMQITRRAPQLLVTLDYDQSLRDGPPFSVGGTQVNRHYADHYNVRQLACADVTGGLKGRVPVTENVWLLTRQ